MTLTRYGEMARDAGMALECRRCGATPGSPCVKPSGGLVERRRHEDMAMHEARYFDGINALEASARAARRAELEERVALAAAMAWHDATCPEGADCRSRELHRHPDSIPMMSAVQAVADAARLIQRHS